MGLPLPVRLEFTSTQDPSALMTLPTPSTMDQTKLVPARSVSDTFAVTCTV
jgi:hypothetical protein